MIVAVRISAVGGFATDRFRACNLESGHSAYDMASRTPVLPTGANGRRECANAQIGQQRRAHFEERLLPDPGPFGFPLQEGDLVATSIEEGRPDLSTRAKASSVSICPAAIP
jgi:hypothetical protein